MRSISHFPLWKFDSQVYSINCFEKSTKCPNHIKRAKISHWHYNHLIPTTDNMTTLLLADSQGKYFEDHLEEHHILTLFNFGDRIDILPKYGKFYQLSSLLLYSLEVITAQRKMKVQFRRIYLKKSAVLIPIQRNKFKLLYTVRFGILY